MKNPVINILLAEDKKFMRDIIKDYLGKNKEFNGINFDLNIFEVENGEDAVLIYAKEKHEIIIMDLTLDKMNGIVATHEILEINPKAQIIGIASEGDDEVDLFKVCGIKSFIEKPFQSTYIHTRIDAIMEEILKLKTIEELTNREKDSILKKIFSK